jgi:hypothetical protein
MCFDRDRLMAEMTKTTADLMTAGSGARLAGELETLAPGGVAVDPEGTHGAGLGVDQFRGSSRFFPVQWQDRSAPAPVPAVPFSSVREPPVETV